ncbi:uncharacterized protein LOC143623771 [Bidens hawaiensis]|uniref:uncharacterized protein LOC143623771 n=1 Tax=Bidens hawaiensis TaxID=980011 RepID=UPI00404AA40E
MSAKWFAALVLFAAFSVLSHTTTAQNNLTAATDRLALLAIKSMINDPQGVMTSWTNSSTSFCQWEGVTCSPRPQRVTLLDLSSRGLTGTLSPSIGNLTFLSEILLFNNSLSGEIPPEIGCLFRLEQLILNNNSFTGSIPTAISNCSSLQALDLSGNLLVGKIPDGIGSLANLSFLALQTNSTNILEGGIPSFIANLTLLDTLSLGDCQLGGRIPDIFHNLTSLRRLALPGNNLVGTIPPSLYNLSSLEQLILDTNRLTGTLPVNLGIIMPNLAVLSLMENLFTGPLPPSYLSSPQLRVIDVARNNFSGKLMINFQSSCNIIVLSLRSNSFGSGEDDEMKFIDELSKCRDLEALDLGYNQLKGSLPESVGNLSTKLYFLSVASNRLSGGIPSLVGNLSGLTTLEFSSNQFTGTLPVTIGNLKLLQRLNVADNLFLGNIPDSLGNLAQMLDMYLNSNQFNGTIPSSLGNCKRLIRLYLDRNNLTGEIPRQLFEISSLSVILNLGNNQLSGELPTEIGNLRNLNEIIVANNLLTGDIPSSIGSCSSLQRLNISNNFFSGSFPASLESLRGLENLDVSHNNFTGGIPTYLEVIPLTSLNLSYNELSGEVPIKGVFANASSVSVNGNSQVCGGVPELRLPECRSNKKKNKLSLAVVLIICFGSVLFFVAMVVLLFVCCTRKTGVEYDHPPETTSGESLIQFSYEALHKATDGFSNKNFIGEGSFSSVYKGCLDTESVTTVAIKVLNLHRQGGSKSFISECEALKNARHRNLTKVITCCSGVDFQGSEFKAIVYEFMPNGSLDKWLHNPQTELSQLSLVQRVCILLDVAYALDYLHYHAGKTIVHCDLKPSNILLDEDMVAHVGDFGLSKILQSEYQYRYNSSSVGVRGTIGYAAPEYGVGSKVSRNGDMYSFGILLLEIMTRKKPTDVMFGEELSLHSYAKKAMGDGALEIIDPVLLKDDKKIGQITNKEETTGYMNHERCLRLLLEIGVSCSMKSPQYRMDTSSVIQELQLIKDAILGDSMVFVSSV